MSMSVILFKIDCHTTYVILDSVPIYGLETGSRKDQKNYADRQSCKKSRGWRRDHPVL